MRAYKQELFKTVIIRTFRIYIRALGGIIKNNIKEDVSIKPVKTSEHPAESELLLHLNKLLSRSQQSII